jgi:aspartyl-tRNA(Asn)/glutamyl-tRNA(Gln) amidotransferase subunit A
MIRQRQRSPALTAAVLKQTERIAPLNAFLTRTALAADFDGANDAVVVNGVKCITRLGSAAYVYPFNLTGHPALTVPSGFAGDGLPTSAQIVGRWGADMDVLRLGALPEEARPWSGKRPLIPR